MLFVDHRQTDASQLGLFHQIAFFLPAVQGRQRLKLALDSPVGADDCVRPTHQPDAHDLMQ